MSEVTTSSTQDPERVESVSLIQAVLFWLKIGFISFGGPPGRFRFCTRSWSSADAGYPNAGSCMPSTTACSYLGQRRSSWRLT